MSESLFQTLLGIYIGVESLGYVVIQYLAPSGTAKAFPAAAVVPFYIPTSNSNSKGFLHGCQLFYYSMFFFICISLTEQMSCAYLSFCLGRNVQVLWPIFEWIVSELWELYVYFGY